MTGEAVSHCERDGRDVLREYVRRHDADDLRVSVLSNGLIVAVKQLGGAPLTAVRVYVRAGGTFEGDLAGSGVSHVLEHVVTGGGTTRRDEREIARLCESIGGLNNAYTAPDHMCYHVTAQAHHLGLALELLADWVARPALDAAVFRRELGVVQRELERDRDDPDVQMDELVHETAYAGHPLCHPVIGRAAALRALRHNDLLAFHARTHRPDNAVVVIVGDVDLDEAAAATRRAFAGFEQAATSLPMPPPPPPIRTIRRAARTMETPSALFNLAWQTTASGHADEAPLDLLTVALVEGPAARLTKAFQWERGLALGLGGEHETAGPFPGLFRLEARVEGGKLDVLESGLVAALAELGERPLGEAELARAKRQVAIGVKMARQTADGWAAQIGEDVLDTGDADFTEEYLRRVGRAAPQDLRRVAETYLRPEARAVATIVPRPTRARAARSASRRTIAQAQAWRTESGLSGLCRPLPHSEFIAATLVFPGGLRGETHETNGLFNLMTEAALRGAGGRDGSAVAEFIAERGASLVAGSGIDGLGFDCVAPAEEFEAVFEVLADVVAEPRFAVEELERLRPTICDAIERIDEDWQGELMRVARRVFFQGTPYALHPLGTVQNVRRLSAEMLGQAQRSYLAASSGICSVAGAIERGRAQELIERCLRRLPRGPAPSLPGEASPVAALHDRLHVDRAAHDRQAAGVFVGFPGHRAGERADRAALAVLGAMLAGYNLAGGRLFAALRGGDRDLAYETAASGLIGVLGGCFAVSAACEPSRVNEAYALIRSEIDSVRAGGFDADELDRGRVLVTTGEVEHLQTPGEFAHRAAVDALVGLDAEDWRTFLEEVGAVKADDLVAVGGKYLAHATVVVVTPEPEAVRLGIELVEQQA